MYGLTILPKNDPLVATAEQAVDSIVKALVPGAFLVDIIPLCANICYDSTLPDSYYSEIRPRVVSWSNVSKESTGMESPYDPNAQPAIRSC